MKILAGGQFQKRKPRADDAIIRETEVDGPHDSDCRDRLQVQRGIGGHEPVNGPPSREKMGGEPD